MNQKQRFAVVVVLVLASIVGTCVAANAESIYLPHLANYYVELEVEYLVCGSPANGVEVYIDVFDGEDKIKFTTDAQGLIRWEGNNASTVIYIHSLAGERFLFEAARKMRVSFQWCDGVLTIVPPPITGN